MNEVPAEVGRTSGGAATRQPRDSTKQDESVLALALRRISRELDSPAMAVAGYDSSL